MPSPAITSLSAEDIQSRVLYRDSLVIALNKPSGMPVHAGFGGGPNLEESFVHLTFGLPRAPSLGHRLDRDTSGCLILGRHRKALQKLSKMFAGGRVRKTYWAIVHGAPKRTEGTKCAAVSRVQGALEAGWSFNLTPAAPISYVCIAQRSGVLLSAIMYTEKHPLVPAKR